MVPVAMNQPTFDQDHYPTEETLKVIVQWSADDFKGLMEFCRKCWQWDDYFTVDGNTYELHTGGWSGNEDVIGALQDNILFWALCWQQSKRGGHYIFEVL
jgi:hypothetical protein